MSQDSSNASTRGKESLSKVDPEVKVKPERRQFTAEYKLRILKEADNCTEPGQIGTLLRREPYVPISIETPCPNSLVYRAKGAMYGNERSQPV